MGSPVQAPAVMTYRVLYHPEVFRRDLPRLPQNLRERIHHAIQQRLSTDPAHYGQPLRQNLKGYWKLRIGDYRVIFQMRADLVLVIEVGHRKAIYAASIRRFIWRPTA